MVGIWWGFGGDLVEKRVTVLYYCERLLVSNLFGLNKLIAHAALAEDYLRGVRGIT